MDPVYAVVKAGSTPYCGLFLGQAQDIEPTPTQAGFFELPYFARKLGRNSAAGLEELLRDLFRTHRIRSRQHQIVLFDLLVRLLHVVLRGIVGRPPIRAQLLIVDLGQDAVGALQGLANLTQRIRTARGGRGPKRRNRRRAEASRRLRSSPRVSARRASARHSWDWAGASAAPSSPGSTRASARRAAARPRAAARSCAAAPAAPSASAGPRSSAPGRSHRPPPWRPPAEAEPPASTPHGVSSFSASPTPARARARRSSLHSSNSSQDPYACGNRSRNLVPCPGVDCTSTSPSWSWTMRNTIESPMPLPFSLVVK